MIDIRPLDTITYADIARIMPGYTSGQRYVVGKVETPEQVTITLELVSLDAPYVRRWAEDESEDDARYREMITRDRLSLGAYDGDWLAGLSIGERHAWNRSLWIWEFGVEEPCRRQGVGRRLMDGMAALGRAAGLRALVVETQTTNVPAICFYRAQGFAVEALDLSYYTNDDCDGGEVAIFMKRKL
jgi:ribosomal protein S18 acetylase RimI-like enzyme